MQLIDGKGRGYQAGVDGNNRLLINGVSQTEIASSSAAGRAFSAGTPMLSVTSTDGSMLYYANNCSVNARVSKVYIHWNGGDTNHNRVMFISFYKDCSAPSANNTASALSNLNWGSGNTASDCVVNYWDEASTGMTVATQGTPVGFVCVAQGQTTMEINDSIIIPNGSTLCVNMRGEEAGEASVIVSMSYEEA